MKGKIFNAQEVQAIILGNKTQFREVIKPQPEEKLKNYFYSQNETTGYCESLFILDKCPYQVGQKIFVKEEFCDTGKSIAYKAKNPLFQNADIWKSAKLMESYHSRLTLLIKEIRVEKLSEISDEDLIKEGYDFQNEGIGFSGIFFGKFKKNWNATHKKPKEKFEANPWVWCVTFNKN